MADVELRANLMTRLVELKEWAEVVVMANERIADLDRMIVDASVKGGDMAEAVKAGQRRDELTSFLRRIREARSVKAPKGQPSEAGPFKV
jgi:hypothetical protein